MRSWIQITSGRGPEECCWVVYRLFQYILREADVSGYKPEVIEMVAGDNPKA